MLLGVIYVKNVYFGQNLHICVHNGYAMQNINRFKGMSVYEREQIVWYKNCVHIQPSTQWPVVHVTGYQVLTAPLR